MFKIINGKRYDTDTAKEMALWTNGHNYSDFNWVSETLYRKKTGEFFLHCEGGPMTMYNSRSGSGWGYGEVIRPLSEEEARIWAEKKLDGDEYEEIFGEVTEDETRKIVTYSLPVSVIEKIKAEAEEKGMTLSDVVASKF